MILINRNTSNTICLTLNEKRTIEDPYYIFNFVNDQTNVSTVFYTANLSINRDRYDMFNITETSTEDLSIGHVELSEGFYHYYIYQSAIYTLDLTLVGSLMESGKVKVLGTTTEYVFEPTYNTTTKVYNP